MFHNHISCFRFHFTFHGIDTKSFIFFCNRIFSNRSTVSKAFVEKFTPKNVLSPMQSVRRVFILLEDALDFDLIYHRNCFCQRQLNSITTTFKWFKVTLVPILFSLFFVCCEDSNSYAYDGENHSFDTEMKIKKIKIGTRECVWHKNRAT